MYIYMHDNSYLLQLHRIITSSSAQDPIFVPQEKAGRFVVAFDPLDGSSNIDCNVSTGRLCI